MADLIVTKAGNRLASVAMLRPLVVPIKLQGKGSKMSTQWGMMASRLMRGVKRSQPSCQA